MRLSELGRMSGKLYRSIENQKKYLKHRDATMRRYESYEDYIKIRHMGFDAISGEDGRKMATDANGHTKPWYFSKNMFPYEIGNGVRHYVLFAQKPMSSKKTEELLGKLLGGKEYAYFRNPPGSRSVPGLWHVQVFAKN